MEKQTKLEAKKATETLVVGSIPAIRRAQIDVRIVGLTSLIVHAWSQKALKEMRDCQQGKAKEKKAPKNPTQEFQDAKYLDDKGRDCVPSTAIKSAIIDAASFIDGVTKVVIRGAIFVLGELIPVEYDSCSMREDPVRVGMGKADLRYRPEYKGWRATFPIEYNPAVISPDQIRNLVNHAGFAIGIGEWRPQKDGQFGRFEVVV